jgi:hypothetical protein
MHRFLLKLAGRLLIASSVFCPQFSLFGQSEKYQLEDGSQGWINYVYNRAYDLLIRDERISSQSQGYPILGDFRPFDSIEVLVVRELGADIQPWLQIDSLNSRDMKPLKLQSVFNEFRLNSTIPFQWIKKLSRDDISLSQNRVIVSFSDIYKLEPYMYLRGNLEFKVGDDPYDYSSSVVFKIQLCEGDIPVFKEAFIPFGLTEETALFRIVEFNDKNCQY